MVQSINWNNYSANQIMELKQQGVQVPDDVYKKAEESMQAEVTQTSDDNKQTSYTVKDTSGQKNEAKELRAQLEAEGASLKSMVKTFTEKSNEATTQLETALKEMEGYASMISVEQATAELIKAGAEDEQEVVMEIVKDTETKVNEKSDEFDFLNEKIEEGTATEEEVAQAETLGSEINGIVDDGNGAIASKQSAVDSMSAKTDAINDSLNSKMKKTGDAYVQAKDAKELSAETYDLGNKLYKKGKKAQTIATAIGALAGGVGGFFAGKAVGNKMNSNLNSNNGFDSAGSSKVSEGRYNNSIERAYVYKNDKLVSTENYSDYSKKHDWNNYGSKAVGALAGAGVGAALGSLFGRGDIKTGQAGMDAAKVLEATANYTVKNTEKIMSENNIAIQITNNTEVSVDKLDTEVSDGAKSIDGKNVETSKADANSNVKDTNVNENSANANANANVADNQDDPNKKKPQV